MRILRMRTQRQLLCSVSRRKVVERAGELTADSSCTAVEAKGSFHARRQACEDPSEQRGRRKPGPSVREQAVHEHDQAGNRDDIRAERRPGETVGIAAHNQLGPRLCRRFCHTADAIGLVSQPASSNRHTPDNVSTGGLCLRGTGALAAQVVAAV